MALLRRGKPSAGGVLPGPDGGAVSTPPWLTAPPTETHVLAAPGSTSMGTPLVERHRYAPLEAMSYAGAHSIEDPGKWGGGEAR